VVVSYLKEIGVARDFSSAALRGFLQLMLLSALLTYVFLSEIWYGFAVPIITLMILLAGYTSARRVGAGVAVVKPIVITTPSITAGALFSLSTLVVLGVIPTEPEFIIPLSGMAFGNSMNICSLTLTRLLSEIKNNKDKIEAKLALGATSDFTVREYERIAIRWSLIPTIDNLRTLGVIFIPGAMTGMLMAGISPVTAAVYQLSIFFMIISSGIMTSVIASHFVKLRIFTQAHQLIL
jgi:putative ABC transport system permease protein